MDETTEQCAIRELEEETGLKVAELHQIGAYSRVDRDPRGRTVTVAYLSVIDKPLPVHGQDDAAKAEWWSLTSLPQLAFDHDEIMKDAIARYKNCKLIKSMDREEIEELAKDLIPMAEEQNASQAIMTADYDDKWEFFMGFRKKKHHRT